ncbi:hypothetical protein ON010_g4637 [Phytophthora cinnamomi]|nr:hypothetical protein ON010_g4637 [Phytophthora cinnamomi]
MAPVRLRRASPPRCTPTARQRRRWKAEAAFSFILNRAYGVGYACNVRVEKNASVENRPEPRSSTPTEREHPLDRFFAVQKVKPVRSTLALAKFLAKRRKQLQDETPLYVKKNAIQDFVNCEIHASSAAQSIFTGNWPDQQRNARTTKLIPHFATQSIEPLKSPAPAQEARNTMNLYAFLLLTSTTAFLVSGETLDAQTTISRVQSPGPLRVVVSPSDEKRSLGASDISKSKMLEIVVYRRKVFKKWLDENHSSMEVFDFFKLGKKKYEMYRKLYNEYRIAPVLSEPFGLSVQSAMGRPRTTGTGKKPKRCTRIAVDYTHKRRILEFLAAGYSVNEAIPHFYPNCSESDTLRKQKQISKWKKQQGHIVAVCDEGKGHLKNLRYSGQGTVLSSDAEGDIVLWINSMRKDGCPVSCQMLKYKAVEVAADEGLSLAIFKASHSWRCRFMRRHKLSIRAQQFYADGRGFNSRRVHTS